MRIIGQHAECGKMVVVTYANHIDSGFRIDPAKVGQDTYIGSCDPHFRIVLILPQGIFYAVGYCFHLAGIETADNFKNPIVFKMHLYREIGS